MCVQRVLAFPIELSLPNDDEFRPLIQIVSSTHRIEQSMFLELPDRRLLSMDSGRKNYSFFRRLTNFAWSILF